MRIARIIIALLSLSLFLSSSSQLVEEKKFSLHEVGLGISFNSVGDEAVLGINLFANSDLYTWSKGRFYYGLSSYYGAFPNTSKKINSYIEGRTTLFQPIQLVCGHQFTLLKNRLLLRQSLSFGPSFLYQRITIDDSRYGIDESYTYTIKALTMHTKLGIGYKISGKSNLELYGNLPILKTNIAPLGAGVAYTLLL